MNPGVSSRFRFCGCEDFLLRDSTRVMFFACALVTFGTLFKECQLSDDLLCDVVKREQRGVDRTPSTHGRPTTKARDTTSLS